MSLINDALKRAKEVQTNNPPPTPENLHLRPAEPATQPQKGIGLVLPATAATVALAALVSFWQLRDRNREHNSSSTEPIVHAATRHPVASVPQTETSAPSTPMNSSALVAPNSLPLPTAAETTPSNTPPVVQAELPKPPPLQLKAIVFNPTHPSALIDGKTVFVGDKVREFRVTAITPVSATLASFTQTNVLTLE